jgi:hypothetical protein
VPPIAFPCELKIDGESYRARPLSTPTSYVVEYIPQVKGQVAIRMTAEIRPSVQIDPLNETDWSDGRGWGRNVDNADGMMLPGPQVTSVPLPIAPGADIADWAEQDNNIYLVGGRYAYKIAGGSGSVTQDQDLGAGFVAVSIEPWKTNLIVGGRTTGNIWQLPSLGAWSQTMVAGNVQRGKSTTVWWNTDGLSSLRMVSEVSPTTLSYVAANPMNAPDWKVPLALGAYPVRSMVATRAHAYAVTTGGIFDFGSDGTAPNLTPDVEQTVMDSNGVASLSSDGYLYFNAGYTLKRLNVQNAQTYGTSEDCGWASQVPPQCPMSGYATALAKYGRWIWASVYDGANTWVCKARVAITGDIVGPLVWFVAPIVLTGLKVTSMHVSGLVSMNPRLWMATVDGSGVRSLSWAYLPLDSAYRDLRQARAYRFATSFQYDSPETDHGDDSLPKFLREFVGEGETLGTGQQIALSVATDGSSAYTPIGTYRRNPRATVRPVLPVMANRYVLRHVGSGTSTTPAVLRKQSRRTIPRPDLLQVRTYQVVVGQEVRYGDGAVDGRTRAQAQSKLEGLQGKGPVPFVDENGIALTTLIVAGMTMTQVEATLGDASARRVMTIDLQVAILATTGTPWLWNDGTRYGDVGKVWS